MNPEHVKLKAIPSVKNYRTLYGGVPQPALVAAGVPDCMMRYERDSKSSVRNIYFNYFKDNFLLKKTDIFH